MGNSKAMPRLFSVLLAALMMMSMSVCAFAQEAEVYNADKTNIRAYISVAHNEYTVFVSAPDNISKINMSATLYQKQGSGYKQVDSMSGSVNGYNLNKSKSYAFQSGQKYKLEVTADVYSNGKWDTIRNTVYA